MPVTRSAAKNSGSKGETKEVPVKRVLTSANGLAKKSKGAIDEGQEVAEDAKRVVEESDESLSINTQNEEQERENDVLKIGDECPDFEFKDEEGNSISLKSVCSESGIIVFIYPKANTTGCTKQAVGFNENLAAIEAAKYKVFGLSTDKPEVQKKWKELYNLNYSLLSDPQRSAIKAFGAFKPPNSTKRSHVIIERGGKIMDIRNQVGPMDSVELVSEAIFPIHDDALEQNHEKVVLKAGDESPDLEVTDEDGNTLSLKDICADSGAIVFIYPKANTPGCTKQAVGFNERLEAIKEAKFEVFGLSADLPAVQKKWKEKYNLNFTILSDPERNAIKAFGAFKSPNSTIRSHVVIERGGKIADIQNQVTPAESVKIATKTVLTVQEEYKEEEAK